MHTLSSELKSVIARRIEKAGINDIMAITGALAALEQVSPVPLAMPVALDVRSRFELAGEDMVRDHSTGLEWARTGSAERMEWKDAKAFCEKLEIGGHRDWRLPTIRELLSIVDYERSEPAIDTDFFTCESSWYWTSTPLKASPSVCAWGVFFGSGGASWGGHDDSGFVRAVRVGQF